MILELRKHKHKTKLNIRLSKRPCIIVLLEINFMLKTQNNSITISFQLTIFLLHTTLIKSIEHSHTFIRISLKLIVGYKCLTTYKYEI